MDGVREAKRRLRRWARSQRPPSAEEAETVRSRLDEWLVRLPPRCAVLVYLALPGEIDLEPLAPRHPALRWLTTRTPRQGGLTIHPFESGRERHRFGFEQPVEGSTAVAPEEVDVALAPGLVFDHAGGRLGWGLGYYDRLLARLRPVATKVGVALERLVVESVPTEPFDVPVDLLATEAGVRKVRR